MKQKLFFIILCLGLAIFIGIHIITLPSKIKSHFASKLSQSLHRPVSIGHIQFHIFKGFTLKNITIFENANLAQTFIHIDEARFSVLYIPVFTRQTFIIPSLKLSKPSIILRRYSQEPWNFKNIPYFKKDFITKTPLWSIIAKNISIQNGTVTVHDMLKPHPFLEIFEDIQSSINLGLNKKLHFKLQTQIPQKHSNLIINGDYSISDKKVVARIQLNNPDFKIKYNLSDAKKSHFKNNLNLLEYLQAFSPYSSKAPEHRPKNWNLKKALLTSADVHLEWQPNSLPKFSGEANVNQLHIQFSDNKSLQGNFQIKDSALRWNNANPVLNGHLKITSGLLRLGDDCTLQGELTATDIAFSLKNEIIYLQGNFTANNARLTMDQSYSLMGNISAKGLQLTSRADHLEIQSALNISQTKFSSPRHSGLILTGETQISSLKFNSTKNTLNILAQGNIQNANITARDTFSFNGNPQFNITYTNLPNENTPIWYHGEFYLTNAMLTGIPTIKKLTHIQGDLIVEPQLIKSSELTLRAVDTNILLSGEFHNTTKPKLYINASTESLELEKIFYLFPSLIKTTKVLAQGPTSIKMSYRGALHPLDWMSAKATARLHHASVSGGPLSKSITNITGEISYQHDLLTWSALNGTYHQKQYSLTGQLQKFSRPVIETSIHAYDLDLTTRVKILRNALKISSLKGQYLDATLNLKGNVHFFKDTEADLDIRGRIAFDLANLGLLIPRLKEKISPFNPRGILQLSGLYRGQISDWRNWQLTFSAQSITPEIFLMDIPLQDVTIKFEQRDQHINNCNISALLYDGNLNIKSSLDLISNDLLLKSTAQIEDLNLTKWSNAHYSKNKNLAGDLYTFIEIKGPLKNINALTGRGALTISNGFLGQLIPSIEKSNFTEAQAEFTIANQKFLTHNLKIYGDTVDLSAEGWIDFQKNIDFQIFPDYNKIASDQSSAIGFNPNILLKKIISIKCTGTLEKRKCTPHSSPEKIFETTTDIIEEGLRGMGSILEGIFE